MRQRELGVQSPRGSRQALDQSFGGRVQFGGRGDETQRNNAQIARELNRSHELMSKVLPSFASAPRHALEVGLEHVASAVAESTRPLFDAVGDFCDARFAQMHAVERSSASSAKDTSAQHIIATVSMLQLSSNAHGDVFSAARGPLFAARLALAERVLRLLRGRTRL